MEHSHYKLANSLLNQHAIELYGDTVSFLVHYWGVWPEHFDNPLHRHSFFEVCYVMDGEGTYFEHETMYPLTKGTIFCSRPGVWHQIKSETGLALFFVQFEVDELKSSSACIHQFKELAEKAKGVIPHGETASSIHIWNAILGLIKQGAPESSELFRHLCHSLLHSFLYLFSDQIAQPDEARNRNMSANRIIHRAKLYIDDNLSTSLSLQEIALYLHISERHLSRLFNSLLDKTFVHYLQERRVQKAVELLLSSDMAIKEITTVTGFESVHYFTRVFTKKIGVSPAMFRKSPIFRKSDSLKMVTDTTLTN